MKIGNGFFHGWLNGTSNGSGLWELPVLLTSVSLFLYARLFAAPTTPYFLPGDQTFFWQYALRMIQGDHPYKDFFQFTPPGLDLYFLSLFNVFGVKVWVASLAAIILGLVLSVVCRMIACLFLGRNEALTTAFFFTVLVYGGHLDATHHWFSLAATLCGVRVLVKSQSGSRVVLAGALFAVASLFTQTVGALGLTALLFCFAWSHFYGKPWNEILKSQTLLVLSFACTLTALNGYFLSASGWKTIWYLQFDYPWHYVDYARGFLVPQFWGSRTELIKHIFLYLTPLFVYPWTIRECWQRRHDRSPVNMGLLSLSLTGLFLLLGVVTRLNWTRLYVVSMPATILGVFLVARILGRHRRLFFAGLLAGTICVACLQLGSTKRQNYTTMDLPGGRIALNRVDSEEFTWLKEHSKPNDYFLQASWPNVYLPLGLRSPVFVEGLIPDRTPSQFVALSIDQMRGKKVNYILWSPWLRANPRDPHPDALQPFRDFMVERYRLVHTFSNGDEVWQLQ